MEDIRNIVKDTLKELYQGVHYAYPTSSRNEFPYMYDNSQIQLPQDINPEREEYLYNNTLNVENDAVQEFPMAEFHKGLQIEKNRNDILDIMEVAQKVLDRLKDNPNFYSEILQPPAAE